MRVVRLLLCVVFVVLTTIGAVGCSSDNEHTSSRGRAVFLKNCSACHGRDAQGVLGPDLTGVGDRLDRRAITQVVHDGRGRMPGFEGKLPADDIDAVVAYVRGR